MKIAQHHVALKKLRAVAPMGLCVILMLMCLGIAAKSEAKGGQVVGWVEEVILQDVGLQVKAKMDSGAKTSSLDADVITITKVAKTAQNRTGKKIIFSVQGDRFGKKKTFEREIIRTVKIKKKGGGFVRRPVVKMEFCIANKVVSEEVNLANRENFLYPVLIGRNMMTHAGLFVNPAQTFIASPNCSVVKKD